MYSLKFGRKYTLNIKNEIMNGADMIIKRLEKNNVRIMFSYPGGCNIPIYNSLKKSPIKTVLCRHEQAGVFMAEGYAKSSDEIGVVCSTSGPGAANLITGIVDAAMDSVPIICISGQVSSNMIGLDSFQELAFSDMVNDYCKYVYKVNHVSQIPRIIDEAFYAAKKGRPGPVIIDIPKDIQIQEYDFDIDIEPVINLSKHNRNSKKIIGPKLISKFLELLKNSKRPVFYIGGGCINSHKILKLITGFIQIPTVSTLMGLGTISKDNNGYYLGMLGMHGTIEANYAVHDCDLLIAIGARFDDRVTGKLDTFAKNAKIIHVDIDSKEIGKNKEVDLGICCDSNTFFEILLKELIDSRFYYDASMWYYQIITVTLDKITQWKKTLESEKLIAPQVIITLNRICKKLQINPIISNGVGQHQMQTALHFDFNTPKSLLTSGGFGTMGFGLGAAIGAWYANKNRTIIDIDGDGSFQMNIQELATIRTENIPIKMIIINNQRLGMVSQWGEKFHKYNDYTLLGIKEEPDKIYPDFCKICDGYDIKSSRVYNIEDLNEKIIEMLNYNGPYLLDVIVENSDITPFIPANKGFNDIII